MYTSGDAKKFEKSTKKINNLNKESTVSTPQKSHATARTQRDNVSVRTLIAAELELCCA